MNVDVHQINKLWLLDAYIQEFGIPLLVAATALQTLENPKEDVEQTKFGINLHAAVNAHQ